ncbi:hypothetical protein O181_077495 [Austropuccinia psidii MF-1]|uniref:Uncharacterized protein n=1 Tax=Austropuccinia psidii MF-1 TaxID=1389203 RepID=A0A9Q3FAV3_9BASI|nr:hypothetical protein [Austropuccinia psidii MF-1]
MGQALLKGVPKLKESPHFNGEGEYDHMEFIRGMDMIKEDFELPDRLLDLVEAQIINKGANDAWRFKVETALESAKFNADKDKALPWFFQQQGRLKALYPDMSEFMIHRKIPRQCGGRILRQSSAIDFTSHRLGHVTSLSRQRQSSHVSHENVTQSPNPFQHYSQCLGNFTSLASASPPNPPQRFACLRAGTALQMRLQHCPPSPSSPLLTLSHPRPYHLYAHVVHSRHHLSLRLCSALPTCSQHHLSLRSRSASQHAPDTTYPYAVGTPFVVG